MSAQGILRVDQDEAHIFWCPGCRTGHRVFIGDGPGPRWTFNGDYERPTFRASVLVEGVERLSAADRAAEARGEVVEQRPLRCHSFVTDGAIQFLGDCTHALAGQTVPLRPFGET